MKAISKMKMRLFIAVILILVCAFFVACGSTTTMGQGGDSDLHGYWNWLGQPYYIFNADGTGTMGSDVLTFNIQWNAYNGILYICNTVILCRGNCLSPTRWNYTVDGDSLTLVSAGITNMTFTYTRP